MHVTFQMNICIKIHIAHVKTHEMGLEDNYECMHRSLTFKECFFKINHKINAEKAFK